MNPLIMLWAHPRSMSTAIERVMRERGDFDCFHEPFLHYYYLERSQKTLAHFNSEKDHPVNYEDTRDMLLRSAAVKPVFAKDMSYYVMPDLLGDKSFCQRVTHCFLIRHPLRSILSYYKLDAHIEQSEIGLESQWQQFCGLKTMGIDSIVVEAESIQQNPQASLRAFWDALGLDFREQALSWSSTDTPDDWQYVEGWHKQVSRSQGIRRADEKPTSHYESEFQRLCHEAPQLKHFLDHHLPFYQQLKNRSIHRLDNAASAD